VCVTERESVCVCVWWYFYSKGRKGKRVEVGRVGGDHVHGQLLGHGLHLDIKREEMCVCVCE
jgi:hypothetical protein